MPELGRSNTYAILAGMLLYTTTKVGVLHVLKIFTEKYLNFQKKHIILTDFHLDFMSTHTKKLCFQPTKTHCLFAVLCKLGSFAKSESLKMLNVRENLSEHATGELVIMQQSP